MSYPYKGDRQPKWLKRVQEQSWEPELLISGLILFALFQTPDLIDLINTNLERQASEFFSNSTANEAISAMLKISVYVLIFGFITHIFLRSVWVAYAGLSYLYKDGINFSKLNLPDMYTRRYKKNSYEDRIKSLEKICSGMFSVSFMFFMIILGLINVGLVISIILYLIITFFPGFSYFALANLVFLLTGILFVIDLLTLGMLRKIPYLRTIYYPFYKVGRLVMLAPLYEDIYYGFLSNNKKWKLGIISVLFTVTFVMAYVEIRFPGRITDSYQLKIESDDDALLFNGHYEDRIAAGSIGRSLIPSDIIKNQTLRIFIPHFIENEPNILLEECLNQDSHASRSKDEKKLNCLNEIYQIAINDSVSSSKGLYQYDPKLDVDGLVYWQDISHLSRGPHTLKTYRWREFPDTSFYQRISLIEFYKESPRISSN